MVANPLYDSARGSGEEEWMLGSDDLSKNHILANLSARELKRLVHDGEFVSFAAGQSLYRDGDPLDCAYFPLGAVVSVMSTMEDGHSVALHLVGNEGVVGIRVILGATVSEQSAIVQVPGACL